jgi:hypothetical protein
MQIIINLDELDDAMIARLRILRGGMTAPKAEAFPPFNITKEPDVEQQDFKQVADFAKEVAETAAEQEYFEKAEADLKALDEKPADLEGVREAMRKVSSEIGTGAVIEIVKRHGAPSASKLDPKHYAAVIADCDAALAKH